MLLNLFSFNFFYLVLLFRRLVLNIILTYLRIFKSAFINFKQFKFIFKFYSIKNYNVQINFE